MKLFSTFAVLAALASPSVCMADRAAILAVMDLHEAAFNASDYEAFVRLMPQGQLDVMAAALDEDADFVVEQLIERIEASVDIVTVEATTFDRDDIALQTTADGTQYAFVTSTWYLRFDADNLASVTSSNFVFLDGDTWVIARNNNQSDILTLQRAYPQFSDLSFPADQMNRVWENEVPPEALV